MRASSQSKEPSGNEMQRPTGGAPFIGLTVQYVILHHLNLSQVTSHCEFLAWATKGTQCPFLVKGRMGWGTGGKASKFKRLGYGIESGLCVKKGHTVPPCKKG